ncbi:hypothetical protein FRC04_005072 [Tulasnella sp. 424]|nr:hypothetical protein FRC04_005072 [Tulasnella sp. 424]
MNLSKIQFQNHPVESERQSPSEPAETPSDEKMAESEIGRDDGGIPAPDEDDQFDVGARRGGGEPEESPRSKRARLAQEKKEKEKKKAKHKREPLRQKDPNA